MSATVNNLFLEFPKAIASEGTGLPSAPYVLVAGASLLMFFPASLAKIVFNVGGISVKVVVVVAVFADAVGVDAVVVDDVVVDDVGVSAVGGVAAVSIPSTYEDNMREIIKIVNNIRIDTIRGVENNIII
jgi:hypothetical protein